VTTGKWAGVDEITSLFHALDDLDSVAARAVLTGEGYVDYTSLRRGELARVECRT
jgi:hypothetical protein